MIATFLAVVMAGVTSALYFTSVDAKSPGSSLVRDVANQTVHTSQTSVTVNKDYTLHGGLKVVPTQITVDDNSQVQHPMRNGTGTGTTDQWNPVTVHFEGTTGLVTVSETLPSGWVAASPPTLSGCELPTVGALLAAEDFTIANTSVTVEVTADVGCTVTFHNEAETGSLLVIKKVSGTGASSTDTFSGTVNSQTSDSQVGTFNDLSAANSKPFHLQRGTYSVSETTPGNGYTLQGYALGNGESCPDAPTDKTPITVSVDLESPTSLCIYNETEASTAAPNIDVKKTDDVGGSTVPGGSFNWTVTVTVTDGPTALDAFINDTLPPGLTLGTVTADSPLEAFPAGPDQVAFILPSGTKNGEYKITVPMMVPQGAACTGFTNHVSTGDADTLTAQEDQLADLQTYSGSPATDTVTVTCADTGSVIVKKDYITHGGTKDVPTVHVEDIIDPSPAINASGQNDATHSEWMPVQVLTRGVVSVWEDLDTTKWRAHAAPTLSGDCSLDTGTVVVVSGLQAIESERAPQASPPNTRVEVRITNSGTCTVTFHNQRLTGTIVANKIATVNGIQQVSEQSGWHITASSAACGVSVTQDTNAGGTTSFTVPAGCSDYVVSENTVNAPFAGYSTVGPSSVGGISVSNGGTATVTFTNARTFFNPPQICAFGCTPLVVTTPTPTPIPPTPTVVPPTPTIAPPTATPTNTPSEAVAGEKTPGSLATPLPPSTGTGGPGGATSNLFLSLVGLVALSGGLVVLGIGAKARR